MPHGEHIEGAAELEALRLGGEPRAEEDQVGEDLVPLVLEVVLGRPQSVVAQLVHVLGNVLRRLEGLDETLVRVAALVGRGAVETHIVELDLSYVERRELGDHFALHPPSTTMACPVT